MLFNWLVSRKAGGRFLLRIEDTDQSRNVDDSVQKILDDLCWLGLNWDEGPEVGGDFGPYFQSRRLDIYNRHLQTLLESGHAYYAMETTEQLAAMRESAKRDRRAVSYVRPDPIPSMAAGQAARAAGQSVVIRLKMPGEDIVVVDDILGDVILPAEQNEDFVIQKSDGFPTYHFACVVDDELMKITHVLRGQEHLMNTPKHIAIQRALGFATPRYAHLPVIFNMDGSKMSKRDKEKAIAAGRRPPEIEVHDFRVAGYLPEAVINFIALLGWSPGDDRESFTLQELTESFSVDRVGKTNAKFDREKLLSFNTTWATRLPGDRLLEAFRGFLDVGSDIPPAMRAASDDQLAHVLRICAGFRTFADVTAKAGFLFVADDQIVFDPAAVKKVLARNDGTGYAVLESVKPRLAAATDWSPAGIDSLLQQACSDLNTGMGNIAQPLRVAVSGTTVSPAIGETLAMLGQDHTLTRIDFCLSLQGA